MGHISMGVDISSDTVPIGCGCGCGCGCGWDRVVRVGGKGQFSKHCHRLGLVISAFYYNIYFHFILGQIKL